MNWRPIRGWTKPLHERGMKADSMPERLLIGPGSPPSIDPVYPELSPPPEPCPRLGTFSAGANTAGQFQQWTPRQFRGRKPLINRDLLQRIAPLFPRKVSASFRLLSADCEKVPQIEGDGAY